MTKAELTAIMQYVGPVLRDYATAVSDRLTALSAKERGLDGVPGPIGPEGPSGRDGRDGLPGVQGEKGLDGRNGLDGRHGKDGADGFGFDDLTVDYDGEQLVTFTFAHGERVKSFPIIFPVPVHKGVFDATKTYERGHQTTWGGSTWQATRQTSGLKPGDGAAEKTGWLLVTKAGRDGKEGKSGKDGTNGRDGKDGKPQW